MTDRFEILQNCRTTIPVSPLNFQLCAPFSVVFIHLQMLKIGCVNYARFLKPGHIYTWLAM